MISHSMSPKHRRKWYRVTCVKRDLVCVKRDLVCEAQAEVV